MHPPSQSIHECAGWSEPLLGAHVILLVLSCSGWIVSGDSRKTFLAHLSQRLIQWWAYRIGRPPSSVCHPHSLNIFSSETTWLMDAKFHMESPWDVGTNVCSNGLGHMTRWLPCPYMVKTFKNLLRNQKADDLETWYEASGALVLPSLFKWWPWVDLDLFYGKVKFGPLCFCMGKR